MLPAFTFNIGQSIQDNLVTVGKFDGRTPSLAFGVTGGKVLVHSPHENYSTDKAALPSTRFLNFNKDFTAITAGSLGGSDGGGRQNDILFVGTESNLLAYDVERNADVFYRDVTDGVNCLRLGRLGHMPKPLVFVGGNCSIFGFDKEGTESFWTVTCDNVTSLALLDVNADGANELVVGSDDFEMRVFKSEEVMSEVTETDKITHLCPLYKAKYGYGLGNGTIGVYESMQKRAWRVKGKGRVTAMEAYDLDADGVPELVSGWSTGSFNVRKDYNGEVIFKSSMGGGGKISALLTADYRLDGKEELIVCAENGEIRGYLPISHDVSDAMNYPTSAAADAEDDKASALLSHDQKVLSELQAKKQELANELRLLEKGLKSAKDAKHNQLPAGTLPPGTAISYALEPSNELECVCIRAETAAPHVVVVNLIAIDQEGVVLSGKEVCSVSPMNPTNFAVLPLQLSRHMACTLRIQTHLAVRGFSASHIHVFEADIRLPKFSSFCLLSPSNDPSSMHSVAYYNGVAPQSSVAFTVPEMPGKVSEWMSSSFLALQRTQGALGKDKHSNERVRHFFVAFGAPPLYNGRSAQSAHHSPGSSDDDLDDERGRGSRKGVTKYPCYIEISSGRGTSANNFNNNINSASSASCLVVIKCDSMELVGDMVQDLARFLDVTELSSVATFPLEMAGFEETTQRITEFNSQRLQLTADMADDSQRIKALIVRAEDSRLMGDMSTMRRAYTELHSLNKQLLGGYNVRRTTHEGLLHSLKEVNAMIQRAANLRLGKVRTAMISECRAAVKANNMSVLLKIIKHGSESMANGGD